jgi:Poly(ADP-ribose) polymerase and DNA-Ligase Zn-finger region
MPPRIPWSKIESVVCEYSPTARAACQDCREKIDKQDVRVGVEVPNNFSDGDTQFKYFHAECAESFAAKMGVKSTSDIQGFGKLKAGDKKVFNSWFSSQPKKRKAPAKGKKRAAASSSDDSYSDESSETTNDQSTTSESGSDSDYEAPKKGKGKAKTKKAAAKTKKAKPAPKKKARKSKVKVDPAVESKKEELTKQTIPQLKELLRLNNQLVGGTKSELVARTADAMVNGPLPKCSRCAGGFLHLDDRTGEPLLCLFHFRSAAVYN